MKRSFFAQPYIWVMAAVALIYGPWIWSGHFAHWDLNLVLEPLRKIHSLSGYWVAVREHQIWDLQPVRDLSYFADLTLEQICGSRVFQFSNLLVFGGILFWIERLLLQVFSPDRRVRWAMIIYATHPAVVNVVCWVAARKHLLSCFFILAATSTFLSVLRGSSSKRNERASLVFFGLSILSQPITLLWPLWVFGRAQFEDCEARLKARRVWLPAATLAVAVGGLNTWYYSGVYASQAGLEKWVPVSLANFGVGFLAQGRYFLNSILPGWVYPLYGVQTWSNAAGIASAVVCFALTFRFLKPRLAVPWVIFYFLPLVIVTFPMTHVFALDAYLMTPLVGILILGIAGIQEIKSQTHNHVLAKSALIGLGLVFTFMSGAVATDWQRDSWLWFRVLKERDSEFIRVKLGDALIREGEFQTARNVAAEIERVAPELEDLPLLFSRATYEDPQLSLQTKLQLLSSKHWQSGWLAYYRGAVQAGLGRFHEAVNEVVPALLKRQNSFGSDLPIIVAEAEVFCLRAGSKRCEGLKDEVRKSRPSAIWNESAYRQRRTELTH